MCMVVLYVFHVFLGADLCYFSEGVVGTLFTSFFLTPFCKQLLTGVWDMKESQLIGNILAEEVEESEPTFKKIEAKQKLAASINRSSSAPPVIPDEVVWHFVILFIIRCSTFSPHLRILYCVIAFILIDWMLF